MEVELMAEKELVIKVACTKCGKDFEAIFAWGDHPKFNTFVSCDHCGANNRFSACRKEYERKNSTLAAIPRETEQIAASLERLSSGHNEPQYSSAPSSPSHLFVVARPSTDDAPPVSQVNSVTINNPHPHPRPRVQSNSAGVAGFVLSLLGVFSLGLLFPIALIFSAVGMRKNPRGLATAGLVLSILGTMWFAFFGLIMLLGIIGANSLETARSIASDIEVQEKQLDYKWQKSTKQKYHPNNRNQIRVITKLGQYSPGELESMGLEAAKSGGFGEKCLIQFFSDDSVLVGWDGTGGLRDWEWEFWMGRVMVDEMKVRRPFRVAKVLETGEPRTDVLAP